MRCGSTSTVRFTPSFMVAASGCAPPMPPRPAVRTRRPRSDAAEVLARRLREGLVGALEDALGADVDPGARPSSGRTSSGPCARARRSSPTWPTRGPASSSRSARAARRGGCGRRPPACRTARAASRRSPRRLQGGARWRRSTPSSAPPCRCRRRRRGRSGRSATSGSRLFISIRSAASCCQERHEIAVPRGARMVRTASAAPVTSDSAGCWSSRRPRGRSRPCPRG